MLFKFSEGVGLVLYPTGEGVGYGGHVLAHGRDELFGLGGICARMHGDLLGMRTGWACSSRDPSTCLRRSNLSDNSCSHPLVGE